MNQVESFLLARDLFLKPDGALYPSQGRIWFSLFSDETLFTETVNKVSYLRMLLPVMHVMSGWKSPGCR
jgi:histone-arginine methyltransferase CARM1